MSIFGYPDEGGGAPIDGDYVTSIVDAGLINGKVLTPGPGIAITVVGGTIIVTNTGSGGGGASATLTYFTKVDETAGLPNSFRVIATSPVQVTYGTNTVTFSLVAATNNTQSLVTKSGSVQLDWAGDVGISSNSGGGTVSLAISSASTQVVDATAGVYVFNLPAASTCPNKTFLFCKTDSSSNSVTINPQIGDTISGQSTLVFNLQWANYSMRSTGSAWVIT